MANPTVTASLSKAAYAPGELMTLTVNHTDADRSSMTISVTVTDSTGATGQTSATAIIDQGVVTVTSSPSRTWTLTASSQNQSVFTATA